MVVTKKGEVKQYPAGKNLFTMGEPGGDLIVIKSGSIAIYKSNEKGEEVEISRMGPGEMLGVMTIFSCSARTATARVIEDAEILHISKEQIHKLMTSCPSWLKSICKDLIARVNIANDKYIEQVALAKQSESTLISPTKIACQISRGIQQFSDLLAEETDGEMSIPISDAVKATLKILCYSPKVTNYVIDGFVKVGLMPPVTKTNRMTLSQVKTLARYSDFVNETKSQKGRQARLEISSKDRRYFWLLIDVSKKLAVSAEKEVRFCSIAAV